ncbi:MAG: hypothetical protein ACREJC_05550 [Tepidisphaeraceae bacterium]
MHSAEASKAIDEIERHAAVAVNKARNGRCQAALMAYADMQRAIGAYEAHTKSGGKGWRPQTAIRDAAAAFNDRCVIAMPQLDGRRRR